MVIKTKNLSNPKFKIISRGKFFNEYQDKAGYAAIKYTDEIRTDRFLRSNFNLSEDVVIHIDSKSKDWQEIDITKRDMTRLDDPTKSIAYEITAEDKALIQSFRPLEPVRTKYRAHSNKLMRNKNVVLKSDNNGVNVVMPGNLQNNISEEERYARIEDCIFVTNFGKDCLIGAYNYCENYKTQLQKFSKDILEECYVLFLHNNKPEDYRIHKFVNINHLPVQFIISNNYLYLSRFLNTYRQKVCILHDRRTDKYNVTPGEEVRNLFFDRDFRVFYDLMFFDNIDDCENLSNEDICPTKYSIFTDGSYKGEYNFGSSFVVVDGNKELYRYIRPGYLTSKYYAKGSTIAEFTAIIEATEFIINKRLNDVTIYSDSADAIKNIISFGKINDNEILCKFSKIMLEQNKKLDLYNLHVNYEYVKGHANSVFNNLADKLAQEALTINIKNYFC